MRWWAITGYGLSVVAHIGLATGIGSIRKDHPRPTPTIIKAFESKKSKKTEQDKPKEDKPPPPPPKKSLEPPPPPKNTPPPPTNTSPTPAGHEAMAALPDFGISLGGGVGEGIGIAVPMGAAASAGPDRAAAGGGGAQEKKVKGPAPKPSDVADACVEEPTKPKYKDRVQPQYTDDARAASLEGKVRLEVTISGTGDVVDVRVVQGLGHGLDQAAVVAMKRTKFFPITRCGKPIAESTKVVIPVNFALSD